QHGIGPETRVGLCVPRSCEMLVGMLGILKAGGAYLPVDPAYPAERIAYTLRDAQVSLIVTAGSAAQAIPSQLALPTLSLDADWERIASQPADNPGAATTPESLCYVIYTSGSTGRPKGVAVEHRGVGVIVKWSRGLLTDETLSLALA